MTSTLHVPSCEAKEECKVTSWFLSFTTIGGLTQINASNLNLSKFVWLLLFLTGVGLTVWNVTQVVRDYLDKKVGTL